MFFKYIIFLFIGAGLSACSFVLNKSIAVKSIPVANTASNPKNGVDSLINPYKTQLDAEMNQKVAFAEVNFINERLSGNLGNMVTSVLLEQGKKIQANESLCLINFGGLRSTINKGDILLGDVFKLLPFDNYLVFVHLKAEAVEEMKAWVIKTGGQPIAGCYLEKGILYDANKKVIQNKDYWVLTSDYLLNGGDNATFFQKNTEVIQPNLLLRDVFLEGIRNKSLADNKEQRIILE